jgi:DNA-binding response OmpR family regulator
VKRFFINDVSLFIADILILFTCIGGLYLITLKADLPFKTSTLNSKLMEEATLNDVYFNFKKQEAKKSNQHIELSVMEFKVMKYFIQREGEVIERNKLLDEVWGYENYPSTRTVDNLILNLRKKIEDDHSNPKHLLTIHGAGYKFVK